MINAQQSLKAIETSLGNLACKIYQEDIESIEGLVSMGRIIAAASQNTHAL